MSDRAFSRVPAATAAEVCRRYQPGPAAAALLRDDLTLGQFVDLLVERRAFDHAIIFLAFALPSREAVWWAALCAREVAGPDPPERDAAALQAAEAWVQDPTEANRRAAGAAGFSSAAGAAAEAAFQSGGSVGPLDGPEVPPKEYGTARSVVRAVMLATFHEPAGHETERYRSFIARSVEVASGANLWTDLVKTDPEPVAATGRTEPRAAANGASAGTDPVTPSKRAARIRWD
jgi:hypothetical protein